MGKKKKLISKKEEEIVPVSPSSKLDELVLKYPPPAQVRGGTKIFREKWRLYLEAVVSRENFKLAHLAQLEVLCDLHAEYSKLKSFIRKNGYTYESAGRNGVQHKSWPEVNRLSRVESLIYSYSKSLGIVLKKDHDTQASGEEAEWE